MPATVPAAYPFIEVRIDTSLLTPVAQRAPGVIAVVGVGAGTAPPNLPIVVDGFDDTLQFAALTGGVPTPNPLWSSLQLALLQDPRPSKIYAVKLSGTDWDAALAALEATDDVTFVSLAAITDLATLAKLKAHAESMSAAGLKRIAVMQIDPSIAKSATYVDTVVNGLTGTPNLKSDVSRVLMIAARGAIDTNGNLADAATAAMAAVAGYAPPTSIVLKRVRGLSISLAKQYAPAEIKGLSEANLVPIIQPALIVGGGFFLAEGRLFTTDASLLYVDIMRTLDDIDFRLKAGLIGAIGDARITKPGLIAVKTRVDGILGPLKRGATIDDYAIQIPVLDILSVPEASWTATDRTAVVEARANRTVDVFVSVTYGPAVHRLRVTLQPKF